MRSSLNVGSHDAFAPLTRVGYGVAARLQHALRPARSARRPATAPLRLNLALRGGGAHGAFTWGALDRLLEDKRIDVAAVSGRERRRAQRRGHSPTGLRQAAATVRERSLPRSGM